MVIVIIHWKIHPYDEAIRQFLDHWRDTLTVEERSHLVGEYLSQPLSMEEAQFPCAVLNTPVSPNYQSYFNVGIWADIESFRKEIILPYVTKKPKTEPFEYAFRERMVLSAQSWRVGNHELPWPDHFA